MKPVTVTTLSTRTLGSVGAADYWIDDGRRMARKEGDGVYQSLAHLSEAEKSSAAVLTDGLKARGQQALELYQQLKDQLVAMGFDSARHLRDVARGRVDLIWAIALTILNATLAVIILSISVGSIWVNGPLAFVVLVTALPIEEFFVAHWDKSAFRECIFLVLALIGLSASFYLGSLRGSFLIATSPDDLGPASALMHLAGVVLRYSLGVLAVVSEILCGFKWWRVRHQLLSAIARAVRRRDHLMNELVNVHASIRASESEPEIRRQYRLIGARQYLAELAREDEDASRFHLRRALMGAGIAILVLIALFFFVSTATAEPIPPSKTKVILLDLTKSSTVDDLNANVNAVGEIIKILPNDGHVIVIGISDAFGRPRLLLDRTVRGQGSFGLELLAAKEVAAAEWRGVAGKLTREYEHTSLLGTIALLPYLAESASYDLVILSDAREDVLVNIEHMAEIDVPRVLKDLQRKKAVPSLPDVRVYMLGVTVNGKTADYIRSLKEFWEAYFTAAGARLEIFRVDRALPF